MDLLPHSTGNFETTKLFLKKIVEILINYIQVENDRNSKVLEFYHPAEMMQIIDLSIPDKPMNLEQILQVRLTIYTFSLFN